MRKQFTFYRSFWDAIEKLQTNKEKLQVFEMICDYALNQTEPDLSAQKPGAATVFCMAKPILEQANIRAEKMRTADKV